LPRVAVILSSGRTGTQFLARYFDANYAGVVARHEPRASRLLRVISNAYVSGALDRKRLLPLLSRLRGRFVERLGRNATLYVESNGFLYGFLEVFAELWPDVAVIHVVRDPRESIRSALGHGNDRGLKRLAAAVVPYWLPDPERALGLRGPLSLIERYAATWTIINQSIDAHASACPDFLRLRFEDLLDERASGLRSLCAHLGLGFCDGGGISPQDRFNVSRRHPVGHWWDWSPCECRRVEEICGALMRRYGYGAEAEWRARLEAV